MTTTASAPPTMRLEPCKSVKVSSQSHPHHHNHSPLPSPKHIHTQNSNIMMNLEKMKTNTSSTNELQTNSHEHSVNRSQHSNGILSPNPLDACKNSIAPGKSSEPSSSKATTVTHWNTHCWAKLRGESPQSPTNTCHITRIYSTNKIYQRRDIHL